MKLLKSTIPHRAALLCLLLLLGFPVFMHGQGINHRFPSEPLPERMSKLSQLSGEMITYDAAATRHVVTPAVDARNESVKQVLASSLEGTGYAFRQNGNTIAVYRKQDGASAPAAANPPAARPGTVKGKVLDERGDFLPGATIKVVAGTGGADGKGTATSLDGDFSLELPAGTYTLEAGFLGYKTQRVTDVKIAAGRNTPLDITLGQASTELAEVVVTATYNQASAQGLYARQKSIAAMSDGVSADLIKKTGDNNVAQVLKRVSGVTIDGGKYVTVRGMSERYNNVQLNGASLPSTEPNRRNFAFDVIPTGLVDNVTIAKTFTPDLPGEFTGGLVEVNTLAVPDKKLLNVSAGTGLNTIGTGKDFKSNKRFKSDWFLGGMDQRQWYAGRTEEDAKQNIINAGRMNTYGLGVAKAAPLQNYGITAGLPFDLGGSRLGVVAAVTYRHEESREEIVEGRMITRDTIYHPSGKASERYLFATSAGAVLNAGWETAGHKIAWRNLFNNRFTHRSQQRYIFKYYDNYNFMDQHSTPMTNRLWQTQLDGEHKLFGNRLIVTWNGSYNKIARTNPDDRYATATVVRESPEGASLVNWGLSVDYSNPYAIRDSHVMFGRLRETKKNGAVNAEFPFVAGGSRQSLKAGYMGTFRDSEFHQLYLKAVKDKIVNLGGLPVEEFFAPGNFGGNPLEYVVSGVGGGRSDFYEGVQRIHAGYLMGDFGLLRKLRLIAGVRAENSVMDVTTKQYNAEWQPVDSVTTRKNTEWLPAATLIYSITPEVNLRAAYSKTLARADFRELSHVNYYNVDDRVFVINPYPIEQSLIHNWDVRAEWYPRPGEVLSASFFHKKFLKPVEMVMRMRQDQQNFDMFNLNLDQSTARGVEVNWRKSLGFVAPAAAFLNDLYFTGNYTWLKADVTYNSRIVTGGSLTEEQLQQFKDFDRQRPLQGLSPYTVNLGLAYEGGAFGAAVNYNRNGRRLIMAGEYIYDDQYENPRDVLDIQLSVRVLKDERLELKFNASDILGQDIIVYRNRNTSLDIKSGEDWDITHKGMGYNPGDWVMSRIRKGVNLSFGASYRF